MNYTKMSVSLGDFEKQIVRHLSQMKGLNNFSSALRMIIHEWNEQAEKVRYEVEGRPESGRQAPQMEAEDGD